MDSYTEGDLAKALSHRRIEPFEINLDSGSTSDSSRKDLDGIPILEINSLTLVTERIRFRAPRWSEDSAGWILAALVDTAVHLGFRSHAILNVSQAG